MVVDVASWKFSFGFAPDCCGTFHVQNRNSEDELCLQNLCEEAANLAIASEGWLSDIRADLMVAEFPALFSSAPGTANCAPYDIELSD